ncbi:DUF397 domain-containing protein [Streptomyces kebangsaanensis]|uniref:DUF397 domain-containing protein n=1 Tax=Streptomyces kebangsaanensis TaxID=864058 RepID=UPI000938CB29|nr:DUF397 domain-containing protein [Streptomyces kebangsaanensis]
MPEFAFETSSYSTVNGECVEVARNVSHTVAVRDSKVPAGPVVRLTPESWTKFTASLK